MEEMEIVMGTLSREYELNRTKYINKISFPLLFNVASSNYTGQYSGESQIIYDILKSLTVSLSSHKLDVFVCKSSVIWAKTQDQ